MCCLIRIHSMIASKFEQLQEENRDKIVDYLMTLKDKIKLEELRFY